MSGQFLMLSLILFTNHNTIIAYRTLSNARFLINIGNESCPCVLLHANCCKICLLLESEKAGMTWRQISQNLWKVRVEAVQPENLSWPKVSSINFLPRIPSFSCCQKEAFLKERSKQELKTQTSRLVWGQSRSVRA